MTPKEAITVLREMREAASGSWDLSPEGRAFATRYSEAIAALDQLVNRDQ